MASVSVRSLTLPYSVYTNDILANMRGKQFAIIFPAHPLPSSRIHTIPSSIHPVHWMFHVKCAVKSNKKKRSTHTHTKTLNRRISHSEAVFIYLQYKFSGYIPSNRVRYYSPVRCGADTFQCVLFYFFFILCRLSTVGKSQVKLVKIITKSIPQPVQSLFETTSVFRCSFVSFEIHRYWWWAGGLCMLILKWSPWTWTVIVA